MQHLSNFVFISMAYITLARRDSYLDHLRSGIKLDTLNSLRNTPLHMATLFPDSALKKAEEAQFENKGFLVISQEFPLWKTQSIPPDWPRVSRLINDSYSSVHDMTAWEQRDFRTISDFKCELTCCRSCNFCCQAQKKGLSHVIVKPVKSVKCIKGVCL